MKIVLLIACVSSSASAVVTSDTAGSHIVAPGQITFGLNVDGVARIETLWSGFPLPVSSATAALISDRHLLTAAHVFDSDSNNEVDRIPGVSTTATFDLPHGSYQVAISLDNVRLIPQWYDTLSDLAIVELDEPAPAAIPRYPLYGLRDEVGKPVILVGYGHTGHGATGVTDKSTVKRAGLNRIDALGEDVDLREIGLEVRLPAGSFLATDFDSGLAANNTFQTHMQIESDLGFGEDEVSSASGDSGGPVFIDGAIAGVIASSFSSFPTDATPRVPFDSAWGTLGFQTRVSTFQEFITTATNGQAVFVPEPSTSALAALVMAIIAAACATQNCLRRRR
ncbi:MAG: trypsin-like serine protease [Pirellulales bacterium]